MSIIEQLKRFIPKSKLRQVEAEILGKRKEGVADGESFGNSADARRTKREAEIAVLEAKRSFILDKRNSWKPKVFWDILVPFIVAILTSYVVNLFIGRQ